MRRAILILLLAGAYVSCASRGLDPARPDGKARPGGEARVLVGAALSRIDFVRSTIAAPLTSGGGLVGAVRREAAVGGAGSCWSLALEGRYPDGSRVRPEDLVEAWSSELAEPDSSLRWLLGDLVGLDAWLVGGRGSIAGLRARGESLSLCFEGEVEDLTARLEHPALAFSRPRDDGFVGPGPFAAERADALAANPSYAGSAPWLDEVRGIASDDAAALLFELDAIDVAVIEGDAVTSLADSAVAIRRLEDWDSTWYLWIGDDQRWVLDPAFRAWLAGSVDRDAMVRYLFDGHAAAVFSLAPGATTEPLWVEPRRRPFASGSRPRLVLHRIAGDLAGERIAARLQQELGLLGVELRVVALEVQGLESALERGEVAMALLSSRPANDDPILRLSQALAPLGPSAADALQRLKHANPTAPALRGDAAWLVEHGLLLDARLVPLLRLEAWLAVRDGLRGVRSGATGRLELERAWWSR